MSSRFRLVVLVPVVAAAALLGLTASASAAPANDNFAGAQAVGPALPVSVPATNVDATHEAGEPMISSNETVSSVWFRWTAPASATVVVDLCDSELSGSTGFNVYMGAYTGATLATQVLVKEETGRCLMRVPALAGTTYNFMVDYRNNRGSFDFKIRAFAPPANDNFATAQVIGTSLPQNIAATTVDAGYQAGEPATLGGSTQSTSIWFSWTAPSTPRARLDVCDTVYVNGAGNNVGVVYTGATLATLVQVAKTTSTDCHADFNVIAGTTYKIAFSGDIRGEMDVTVRLKAATPPANDNFAAAQALGPGVPLSVPGDNDFATKEAGEPDHGGYSPTSRSVWYSWTAGVTGRMRLKSCAPDTTLHTGVYTGATLATLTAVGERFQYADCSTFFDAVAGTNYRFAVAGGPFEGDYGPFTLELHRLAQPPNDSFASSIDLGSGVAVSRQGTTVDASTEEDEPDHSEEFYNYGGSVWYRWTAPNDSAAVISACSSTEPNVVSVYEEDPEAEEPGISALRGVDDDGSFCRDGTKGGRLAIAPVKGVTYYLAVSSAVSDFESPFTLKIQGKASTAKPAPFNLKKAVAKCKKLKGKKKRTRCIKAARRKAALIKCKKIENGKKRAKCIKSANRRFK